MAVFFAWRYHPDPEMGVKLEKAGLVFLQHMNINKHYTNLQSLACLLRPRMDSFSTQVAIMQAGSSSSTTASDYQMASIEGGSEAPATLMYF